MGVAGYGCIAGAIVFNSKANDSYNAFRSAETTEAAQSFLNEATRQDNLSEALAYTAIAVWVTDVIWTMIQSSRLREQAMIGNQVHFSMDFGMDPYTYIPLIGLAYMYAASLFNFLRTCLELPSSSANELAKSVNAVLS